MVSMRRLASRSCRGVGRGARDVQVEGHRDRGVLAEHVLDRPAGEAVREVEVVDRGERGGVVGHAGGVHARRVAEERRAPRLVERGPHVDPVAQHLGQLARVLAEADGGLPVGPAALVLERLREVPVVERRDGLDAGGDEAVREVDVEVETGLVELARAGGLDAGPRDREPVGLQAEVLHDRDVLRRRGGSGRPRRRRCRRRAPCRACGRTCPRWTGRGRPRRTPPRSGTRRWPSPRGSRRGTGVRRGARSSWDGPSVGRRSTVTVGAQPLREPDGRVHEKIESIRYTVPSARRHSPVPRGGEPAAQSGQLDVLAARRPRRVRRPPATATRHGASVPRASTRTVDPSRVTTNVVGVTAATARRHGAVAVGELDEAQRDAVGPVVVRPVRARADGQHRVRADVQRAATGSRAARGPSAVRSPGRR